MLPQPAIACPLCAEQIHPPALVCRRCGREPAARRRREGSSFAGVSAGVAAAGVLATLSFHALQHGPENVPAAMKLVPASVLRPGPAVLPLLDADALHVPAGTSHGVSFSVDDARPCVLTGRVRGIAGGRREVEVYVLDRAGIPGWSSGTGAHPLFRSGRKAAVRLQVALPGPGDYHLLVSNRFAAAADKTVRADARVTCG